MIGGMQRTVLSLTLGALLAVGVAASASALPPVGGFCDAEIRSCASDSNTGGGSYAGSEPRPKWIHGQEFGVAPGAPGWKKNTVSYEQCDDWFKYVALPAGQNAAGQVVVLRLAYYEKRWWFLWC